MRDSREGDSLTEFAALVVLCAAVDSLFALIVWALR
jgi:hypothetical protein